MAIFYLGQNMCAQKISFLVTPQEGEKQFMEREERKKHVLTMVIYACKRLLHIAIISNKLFPYHKMSYS